MSSICSNLGLNVNKYLLKTAFYKLRQRHEGRIGLKTRMANSRQFFKIYFYYSDYIWKWGSSVEAKLAQPSKLTQRGKRHSPGTFCFPCCCCPLSSGAGKRMMIGEQTVLWTEVPGENVLIIHFLLSDYLHVSFNYQTPGLLDRFKLRKKQSRLICFWNFKELFILELNGAARLNLIPLPLGPSVHPSIHSPVHPFIQWHISTG